MKQKTSFYVLKLGVTLFLICAIVAGLLGVVDYITKKRIETNTAKKIQDTIALVLPQRAADVEAMPVSDAQEKRGITAAYRVGESFAVKVETGGSQGTVSLMVGIGEDGLVQGVQIISHAETPGLGATAAANGSKGQQFRDQFVGISAAPSVTMDGGEITALTGATVTSRAVCNAVAIALEFVEEVQK